MSVLEKYHDLRFLGPPTHWRDNLDQLLESLLLQTVQIKPEGLENIPSQGSFVLGFMPHSGILEPFVVNKYIKEKGRFPPVWITKKESQEGLTGFLLGNRSFLYWNRENPEKSAVQAAIELLKINPQGIVGSAIEGTRTGNPADRYDLRTLGKAKPGLVYIATQADVPILPVVILGAEQVLPDPDRLKAKKGVGGVIWEYGKAIKAEQKPYIKVRFGLLYTDHLNGSREITGREFMKHIVKHTDTLVRQKIVPMIQDMDPNYPLGPYTTN